MGLLLQEADELRKLPAPHEPGLVRRLLGIGALEVRVAHVQVGTHGAALQPRNHNTAGVVPSLREVCTHTRVC